MAQFLLYFFENNYFVRISAIDASQQSPVIAPDDCLRVMDVYTRQKCEWSERGRAACPPTSEKINK